MKIYYYVFNVDSDKDWFHRIILFDGENTYWSDEMKPSGGYKNRKMSKVNKLTNSKYVYVGEL